MASRQLDTNGVWHVDGSTAGYSSTQFGLSTDIPAVGDFDGDGKADISVFRQSDSTWYRINSSNSILVQEQFGTSTDLPVPADFDGNGKADKVVFHPSTGVWTIRFTDSQAVDVSFQWESRLINPQPQTLMAMVWPTPESSASQTGCGICSIPQLWGNNGQYIQFGASGDIPTAADYDGDGKTDIAVWRPSNTTWYVLNLVPSYNVSIIPFGLAGDIPVPGDYDGDGKYDVGIWRPSTGDWHIIQSQNGYRIQHFGAQGDVPVPKRVN